MVADCYDREINFCIQSWEILKQLMEDRFLLEAYQKELPTPCIELSILPVRQRNIHCKKDERGYNIDSL